MKEECFDLDLYTWTKINPSDEVTIPSAGLTHITTHFSYACRIP